MNRAVLIQTPAKFFQVACIFCDSCISMDFADKVYVVTDYPDCQSYLPDKCIGIQLEEDYQFSSNMLKALPLVKEDIFLVCCEDHIPSEAEDAKGLLECFQFVKDNEDVGFLRLTCHDKIPRLKPNKSFSPVSKGYRYYVTLEFGIWRKEFFKTALKDGDDAWLFETKGSRRCSKYSNLKSYCTDKLIFRHRNFLRKGELYRNQYIDYAVEHKLSLPCARRVYYKKKEISFAEYLELKGYSSEVSPDGSVVVKDNP